MLALTYSLADQNFFTTKSVGIFNVSLQLLEALLDSTEELDVSVVLNTTLKDRLKRPARVSTRFHDVALGGRLGRIYWDQWGVYRTARDLRRQWLFLPKGFASFLQNCPVKLAVYVHDTLLESYYAEHSGVSAFERLYFGLCLRASLKQARVVFTNSDFTCRELDRAAKRWRIIPPRIINAGIGFERTTHAIKVPNNQILVLTGVLPHKRADLAVQYLARWQQETKHQGNVEWVGQLPSGLSLPQFANWRHNSRLPPSRYCELIQQSQVLVYFSDYEGFGMPPVEAVFSGLCPVYSEIEATREVMAGMGCPFQNNSFESFARALQLALSMPKGPIADWKQILSDRFNWPRVRQRVIETLRCL